MDKKTLLYAGGIIVALVVIYSLFKSSQNANTQLAIGGGYGTSGSTVNDILNSSAGSQLVSTITGAFSGIGDSNAGGLYDSSSSDANDPGLDDSYYD